MSKRQLLRQILRAEGLLYLGGSQMVVSEMESKMVSITSWISSSNSKIHSVENTSQFKLVKRDTVESTYIFWCSVLVATIFNGNICTFAAIASVMRENLQVYYIFLVQLQYVLKYYKIFPGWTTASTTKALYFFPNSTTVRNESFQGKMTSCFVLNRGFEWKNSHLHF